MSITTASIPMPEISSLEDTTFVSRVMSNKYAKIGVYVALIALIVFFMPKMPNWVAKLFGNPFIRLGFVALIIWIALEKQSVALAILLAVILISGMQMYYNHTIQEQLTEYRAGIPFIGEEQPAQEQVEQPPAVLTPPPPADVDGCEPAVYQTFQYPNAMAGYDASDVMAHI